MLFSMENATSQKGNLTAYVSNVLLLNYKQQIVALKEPEASNQCVRLHQHSNHYCNGNNGKKTSASLRSNLWLLPILKTLLSAFSPEAPKPLLPELCCQHQYLQLAHHIVSDHTHAPLPEPPAHDPAKKGFYAWQVQRRWCCLLSASRSRLWSWMQHYQYNLSNIWPANSTSVTRSSTMILSTASTPSNTTTTTITL